MTELDLSQFERQVLVRPLQLSDYDQVVELQKICFPTMGHYGKDQFESQLKHFPEGQLGVEYDGRLVASSSSLIVEAELYTEWHNWMAISDSGYIRNHNPQGNTLYGIEIMVHPDFRGQKLSRRLYDARKQVCRERNLASIIIAGRIPGYGKFSAEMSAREYVERVMERKLFDPVLTAQTANGFVLKGLIPNYLPSDAESRGYAAFLEWTNLEYRAGAKRRFHSIEPVRLGVVQYEMRPLKSFEEFGWQCEYFIDTASDYKCDFVLFPELFTIQLLSLAESKRPGQAARQVAQYTPQYLELFGNLALKYNVNVIAGSHFTLEDDNLYNVSYLFHRDGGIDKQYKLHVTPSESHWWGVQPGNKLNVFDTDRGRIAILICYDVQFPELCRIAAQKGANILFVPFNTDPRQGYLRVRLCAQARCIENHVYVALSGCTGNLPFVENVDIHYAQSGIYTPADFSFSRDAIAAECNANVETMLIHDVDLELLRRHRHSGTVQNWRNRRRDLYKITYQEDGNSVEI